MITQCVSRYICSVTMTRNVIKSVAVVGGLVSLLGLALYPVVIEPLLHSEKYIVSDNPQLKYIVSDNPQLMSFADTDLCML